MKKTAAILSVVAGMSAVAPANAGTVPPPITQGSTHPHPASDRPLVYLPTTNDTLWDRMRRDGP